MNAKKTTANPGERVDVPSVNPRVMNPINDLMSYTSTHGMTTLVGVRVEGTRDIIATGGDSNTMAQIMISMLLVQPEVLSCFMEHFLTVTQMIESVKSEFEKSDMFKSLPGKIQTLVVLRDVENSWNAQQKNAKEILNEIIEKADKQD